MKRRPLINFISTIDFVSLNNKSTTRIKENSSTNIDVVYTNSINVIDKMDIQDCPFSDHHSIVVSLNLESPKSSNI